MMKLNYKNFIKNKNTKLLSIKISKKYYLLIIFTYRVLYIKNKYNYYKQIKYSLYFHHP